MYLFPPEKHFFFIIPFIPCVFTHTRQWGGRQTGKAISWFQGWESKDVDHRDPAAQTINQLAFQTLCKHFKTFFFFFLFLFLLFKGSWIWTAWCKLRDPVKRMCFPPRGEQRERSTKHSGSWWGRGSQSAGRHEVGPGPRPGGETPSLRPGEYFSREQSAHSAWRQTTKYFCFLFFLFAFLTLRTKTVEGKTVPERMPLYKNWNCHVNTTTQWVSENGTSVVCAYTVCS